MKKAIIIGATSGMGKGLAEMLVQNGYRVGITGRRESNLHQIQQAWPGMIFTRCFDAGDTAISAVMLRELIDELGGLDLLVYSSGAGFKNDELEFEIELATIRTNVTGFTLAVNYAFNYFRRHGHGHIAAISSISGFRGNPEYPSYFATKAYIINYLEGLRIKACQLRLPITVTDIRPGFVNTTDVEGEHRFWTVSPEKAVRLIYSGLMRRRAVIYVSRRWRIIAAFMRILPRGIYRRIMLS